MHTQENFYPVPYFELFRWACWPEEASVFAKATPDTSEMLLYHVLFASPLAFHK